MSSSLVVVERPADLTTPVAVMRALLSRPEPCFLLESVEGGERLARWSFLGTAPSREISGPEALARLRELPRVPVTAGVDLPPFTGGAVGYAGYDFVRRLERLPERNPDTLGLPDTWFGVFEDIVAFDHVKHRLLFIAHAEEGGEEAARIRLAKLATFVANPPGSTPPPRIGSDFEESLPRAAYVEAVEKAKEHIRAGDIFQVVLSRRWTTRIEGDPFPVYRALRRISPSPYQYYLRTPHGTVFGASPERLVRVKRDPFGASPAEIETLPLAGTRARGATPAEDAANAESLLADPKERAEHVMLVDLGRNDLGRVAAPGSVSVPDFFTVQRYSHVMHLASRVTGLLSQEKDSLDALTATFPAGTLTGAPKIRAMEIIEELEPVRRGAYGGAVGYLDFAGNLDVAIAIRTAVVTGGVLSIQAGAGIVADSSPEAEADECENKALALRRAVEASGEYAS